MDVCLVTLIAWLAEVAPPVNEVEEDACFMTSTDSM